MTIRALVGVVTLFILGGCFGGPATRYFVLSPVSEHIERTADQGPVLGIWRVSIPEYLDRENLVEGSGANEVRLHEGLRWAEPLDEGVSRVLRQNIRARCDGLEVRVLPETRGSDPVLVLHPRIRQFERRGDSVLFSASVQSRPAAGPEQTYSFSVACEGQSGADTVACMSAALAEFSQRLMASFGDRVGCSNKAASESPEKK